MSQLEEKHPNIFFSSLPDGWWVMASLRCPLLQLLHTLETCSSFRVLLKHHLLLQEAFANYSVRVLISSPPNVRSALLRATGMACCHLIFDN